jgi:FAD binding domain
MPHRTNVSRTLARSALTLQRRGSVVARLRASLSCHAVGSSQPERAAGCGHRKVRKPRYGVVGPAQPWHGVWHVVFVQDFKSASVPLEWVLQAAPRLKPRLFSIASSLRVHPRQAHVLAAVVEWRTPFKRRRRVCADNVYPSCVAGCSMPQPAACFFSRSPATFHLQSIRCSLSARPYPLA